jgi:hypothetical protein
MRQTATLKIIAADINVSKQISLVPYPNPAAGKAITKKLMVTNNHATDPTHVKIWDQDLVNSNVPTTGAVATPLITVICPAQATTCFTEDQLPNVVFQSGYAAQITKGDAYIHIEYAKDLG